MEEVFGVPFVEAYGMTEASHQMSSNLLPPKRRKAGSVGSPTGIEISIMDFDGHHVPQGERAEVVIKGPSVFSGYENNAEANASSFVDGWFRTGDQGYLDDDNFLHLTGRIKDLIIRGGENIAPREIDEILLKHEAVAAAVAFGAPHPLGEEVVAAVVLHQPHNVTEKQLIAYCGSGWRISNARRRFTLSRAFPRQLQGKSGVAKSLTPSLCGRRRGRMKFLVAGAGAIGAYIAALMTRAGFDVTIFARGAHLRAMQERGVRVISAEGEFEARPRIAGTLGEVGPVDVVFLTVKAHGLTQLAPQLAPVLGPDTAVVSTQNGITWWPRVGRKMGRHAPRTNRSWWSDLGCDRAAPRDWIARVLRDRDC